MRLGKKLRLWAVFVVEMFWTQKKFLTWHFSNKLYSFTYIFNSAFQFLIVHVGGRGAFLAELSLCIKIFIFYFVDFRLFGEHYALCSFGLEDLDCMLFEDFCGLYAF